MKEDRMNIGKKERKKEEYGNKKRKVKKQDGNIKMEFPYAVCRKC